MSGPAKDDGYNYIYSKLVDDDDDILGIISYSFYKQQKIEFIREIQEKHARRPNDDELRAFNITSNSPASLESFKVKAEALSREFVEAVLDEQIKEIQGNSDQELAQRVKALRPIFWQGIAQNILASLLFVLFIGLIVFTAWSSKYGFTQAVEQIMGVNIQEQHSAAVLQPAQVPSSDP